MPPYDLAVAYVTADDESSPPAPETLSNNRSVPIRKNTYYRDSIRRLAPSRDRAGRKSFS